MSGTARWETPDSVVKKPVTYNRCLNNSCAKTTDPNAGQSCSSDSQCFTSECNPPHSVNQGGRCVPSCGAAGGDTSCDAGGNCCDGYSTLEAYDVGVCCRKAGNGGGNYHMACVPDDSPGETDYSCRRVPGGGSNQCSVDGDCNDGGGGDDDDDDSGPPPPPPPPPEYNTCTNDGACIRVQGSGSSQCSDPGNPDSADCPQPPPSCSSFTADLDKVVIPPPREVTLSWQCRKAHSGCTITPDVGSVPQSGQT